jgi:hypothetical protein
MPGAELLTLPYHVMPAAQNGHGEEQWRIRETSERKDRPVNLRHRAALTEIPRAGTGEGETIPARVVKEDMRGIVCHRNCTPLCSSALSGVAERGVGFSPDSARPGTGDDRDFDEGIFLPKGFIVER